MITLDNVWGFRWSMHAMRLAHKANSDSIYDIERIGKNDYDLALKLIKSASSHSKFLRTITVWLTIEASRSWWQQWSTYNFSIQLSESTHYTILKKKLGQEDFINPINPQHLEFLNNLIEKGDKIGSEDWKTLKYNLPESYIQKRAIVTNYQTLRTAYHQRLNDPHPEWSIFCEWINTLPYKEFIVLKNSNYE